MRKSRVAHLMLLMTCLLLAAPMAVYCQNIEVSPLSWDFGDVVIGETATMEFSISSIGPSTVQMYLAVLTAEPDLVPYLEHDFTLTDGPALRYWEEDGIYSAGPIEIDEGSSVAYEVTYSPTTIGLHNAELLIMSNDYDPAEDAFIYVHLFGNGVDPGSVPVPEPTSILLLSTGLIGLAALGRRKFVRS